MAASNGVVLHYIKTSPNNIIPKAIGAKNLKDSGEYGVNAGFFDFSTGDLLSIAVDNDVPVKGGSLNDYGNGSQNTLYKRGTLVWNKVARTYSVQVLLYAKDLDVNDRDSYWAIGGISMALDKSETDWKKQVGTGDDYENLPGGFTTSTKRAGLVYNSGLNIYLIVTHTSCTAAAFRTAILEKISVGSLVDGISLDGSDSAQLQCAEKSLTTSRKIYYATTLINRT